VYQAAAGGELASSQYAHLESTRPIWLFYAPRHFIGFMAPFVLPLFRQAWLPVANLNCHSQEKRARSTMVFVFEHTPFAGERKSP